ncbi:Uncharacterized protein PECH_004880 [Penicillium ucsense]|uniref:Uncharacterized protein n=1 Tax=Penicillium ucsense TaxID=2839758 RepID=A0A8J8W9P1_9EURO|nr:Uncharacterized protein PECM_006985 [Penicillium ucsense]KAF7736815.1 Uncharacterized protein PECH_004880 [Penicillium ucsense]
MGRINSDDRADAASSHSLHSLPDEDDLPPPYTDEPELDSSPIPAQAREIAPSRSNVPFRPLAIVDSAYAIPGSTGVRSHDARVVSLAPQLSHNAEELFELIRRQLKLPVRPMLHIRGSHTDSSKDGKDKKTNQVVDFEFRLDLAETMLTGWEGQPMDINFLELNVIRDDDDALVFRGGRMRSRTYKPRKTVRTPQQSTDSDAALLGSDLEEAYHNDEQAAITEPSLRNNLKLWCERYCLDPSPVKSFTIHRELKGFDSKAMRNIFNAHIRELNYRGSIDQGITQAHRTVTIYSPHWINRLRTNNFVWWIVVLLQLWIITWPIIWFVEKRYEIASARWNASLIPEWGNGLVRIFAQGRDESALAEWWAPAVKQAAWTCRSDRDNLLTRLDAERMQGMTTAQIVNTRTQDSAAESERRQRVARGEGGFVDNVVGLARGISEVGQDWRFSTGWGANT